MFIISKERWLKFVVRIKDRWIIKQPNTHKGLESVDRNKHSWPPPRLSTVLKALRRKRGKLKKYFWLNWKNKDFVPKEKIPIPIAVTDVAGSPWTATASNGHTFLIPTLSNFNHLSMCVLCEILCVYLLKQCYVVSIISVSIFSKWFYCSIVLFFFRYHLLLRLKVLFYYVVWQIFQ